MSKGFLRLLLVEDNVGDARLIQEYLRGQDGDWCQLIWEKTLKDGLRYLASEPADAILLDLGLPDSQGMDGFQRIRKVAPQTPVIILTGLDDKNLALEAVAAGAQDWLLKGDASGPVLKRAIRYAVERKKIERALARSVEELRLRNRISEILLSAHDDAAYGELMRIVLAEVGADLGFLATREMGRQVAVRAVVDGERVLTSSMDTPEGGLGPQELEGLLFRALESGEVRWAREGPIRMPGIDRAVGAVMAAPILNRGKSVGLIAVGGGDQAFREDHLNSLEAMAIHLAPILAPRIERDLQARKRRAAEEELRTLNRELEARVMARTAELHASNQELEAFAYSVSHDLRAPLRSIDGFSRILGEDHAEALGQEGKRVLDVVRKNAARMGALIDDLLEFSRVGRKAMELGPVDMETLVRDVLEEVAGDDWRVRGGKLTIGLLPSATGDPSLLRQVWVNLLSNAVKFSGKKDRPIIEVTGRAEGDQAVFTVTDNGVGFDMAYVDKLFGVFERLHHPDEFDGTGVGLAVAARIVERHGGRIWGESVGKEGAFFSFTLPHGGRQVEANEVTSVASKRL